MVKYLKPFKATILVHLEHSITEMLNPLSSQASLDATMLLNYTINIQMFLTNCHHHHFHWLSFHMAICIAVMKLSFKELGLLVVTSTSSSFSKSREIIS